MNLQLLRWVGLKPKQRHFPSSMNNEKNQISQYQRVKDWREKNPEAINAIKKYNNRYRVVGYLPPRYAALLDGYVTFNDGESQSSCVAQMIKKFFDGMPEQERKRILSFSKNSY